MAAAASGAAAVDARRIAWTVANINYQVAALDAAFARPADQQLGCLVCSARCWQRLIVDPHTSQPAIAAVQAITPDQVWDGLGQGEGFDVPAVAARFVELDSSHHMLFSLQCGD